MSRTALLLALAIASPALAQEKPAQDGGATILVTGTPLDETARQLKQCLARHCPPKEDIEASIAHAENQYLAGDFAGSRDTLANAHHRNARYARQYPVEVSDLQRAYGRLTDMNGRADTARLLQIFAFETLRDEFGSNSARVLSQQLMTGDGFLAEGRLNGAMDVYRRVERKAHKAGERAMEGRAMLRQAAIYASLAQHNSSYAAIARAKMERLEQTTEPEFAPFRTAAMILRARLAAAKGDSTKMEAAIAAIAGKGIATPILIYDPQLLPKDPTTGTVTHDKPEWIDLRYRIDRSGHVHDLEQLRSSPVLSGDWADQVRDAYARRRYAPLDLPAGSDGLVRIERLSLVFDVTTDTGSRMPTRSSRGRIVALDLTPDEQPASGG